MDDNLYSAPRADLAAAAAGTAQPRFYVVSPRKFLIMAIASFGYYIPYWFYRNWREYNNSLEAGLWPVMRGLFSLFFVHQFARILQNTLQARHLPSPPRLRMKAMAFVGYQISIYTLAVKKAMPGDLPFEVFEILAVFAVALTLVEFQKAVNIASDDPGGAANGRLTGANWAWVVLGVIWWGLSALQIIAPE
jgi:hypothetical protein